MNKTKIIPIIGVFFLLTCSPIKKAERIIYESKYEYYRNYSMWLDQWKEIQKKGKVNNTNIALLRGEASVVFTDLLPGLESSIIQGDEKQAKNKSNEIKKYYDQIRYIDNEFDKNQRIANLNDKYLADAGTLAKINLAKSYASQNNYEIWLSKWEELRLPLRETDKIDLFNFQAYTVFNSIISQINIYRQNGEITNIKNLANSAITYLRHANRINENFDNYIAKTKLKNTVNEEYLNDTEIWAKMDEAQKLVDQKEFVNWYNLWKSIAPLKKNIEKERFNEQSIKVFSYLLSVLIENIQNGNVNKTSSIANQTKEIFQGVLENLNSNYQETINEHAELKDLNFVYLNSANYFSQGYNFYNQKNYKGAIEIIRNSCNFDTIPINKHYIDFVRLVTNRSISDLNDYYSGNDIIKESNELANLSYILSNHKNIEFDTPKFLNDNNYNINNWYEIRVNDYLLRSYNVIENDIHSLNYERALKTCIILNQFSTNDLSIKRLKDYQNQIKLNASQYYLRKASDTIKFNAWVLGLEYAYKAKYFLNEDSLTANFLIDKIRALGRKYFENMYDSCLFTKNWELAYKCCTNIGMLSKKFDKKCCDEKVDFEAILSKALFFMNSEHGCYRTAMNIAEEATKLTCISDNDKNRLNCFIKDCKTKMTIRLGILDIITEDNITYNKLPSKIRNIPDYTVECIKKFENPYISCRPSSEFVDIIKNEFNNYLLSHSETSKKYLEQYGLNKSVDYLIGIRLIDYEFIKGNWNQEIKEKEICTEEIKYEDEWVTTGTRTFKEEVYITDAEGNRVEVWKTDPNTGTIYRGFATKTINVDKPVGHFEKVPYYRYSMPIKYYEKKGIESLRLNIEIILLDIRKIDVAYMKHSDFKPYDKRYCKLWFKSNDNPDISKLHFCPSANYGTPLANSTNRLDNYEDFNCVENPFRNSEQIIDNEFKYELNDFIQNQIKGIVEYIETNNKYECK